MVRSNTTQENMKCYSICFCFCVLEKNQIILVFLSRGGEEKFQQHANSSITLNQVKKVFYLFKFFVFFMLSAAFGFGRPRLIDESWTRRLWFFSPFLVSQFYMFQGSIIQCSLMSTWKCNYFSFHWSTCSPSLTRFDWNWKCERVDIVSSNWK